MDEYECHEQEERECHEQDYRFAQVGRNKSAGNKMNMINTMRS